MFRKLDLFQCNRYVGEHAEHKTNFTFAHAPLQETLGKQRKRNSATQKYTKCTHSNICQVAQFTACYEPHPSTSGVAISIQFQIALPSTTSQAPTLLTPTSICKLRVFFKVKCHIYYSTYVFLHNLTCVKLLVFISFLPFDISLTKFLSVMPPNSFSYMPCGFYYNFACLDEFQELIC